MFMQTVKFRSNLKLDEVRKKAKERAPEFEKMSGLIQKYYVRPVNEDYFLGVYVWEDQEALGKYQESELAASLSDVFDTPEPPEEEVFKVDFTMREENVPMKVV